MDADRHSADVYRLTAEHRMLLQMRDTLYEGSWEDFIEDLRAREEGRPHVFETIPDTPGMKDTIHNHLDMIADMRLWEEKHGARLKP